MLPTALPALLKHTTLAIYAGGSVRATTKHRFRRAFEVARAALTQQGYLAPGSDSGPLQGIRLTARGEQRNAKHAAESGVKTARFDSLSSWLTEKYPNAPGGAQKTARGGQTVEALRTARGGAPQTKQDLQAARGGKHQTVQAVQAARGGKHQTPQTLQAARGGRAQTPETLQRARKGAHQTVAKLARTRGAAAPKTKRAKVARARKVRSR